MTEMAVIDDLRPDLDVEEQLALPPSAFPFAPLKALAAEGALTPVSLDLTVGPELTYRGYEKLGFYLGLMNRSCMWWIGDWLLYGEGRYGERFSQALSVTGLAEQTLLNRMTICRSIPPTERRVGLSFSIHAELAPLSRTDRRYWLDRAERNGWTKDQLRQAMKVKRERDQPELNIEDDLAPEVDEELLKAAAHAVVDAKQEYGADYLVPREPMARLMAALGEET